MTDTLIQRLRRHRGDYVEEMDEAADALEQQAADLAYVKAASVFNLMEENKRQAAQIAEKDAEIARLHKALDSAYAQAMENGATANALRADAERMRGALNFIAEHMCSDWSQRCQAMVNTARAALRQEQPT